MSKKPPRSKRQKDLNTVLRLLHNAALRGDCEAVIKAAYVFASWAPPDLDSSDALLYRAAAAFYQEDNKARGFHAEIVRHFWYILSALATAFTVRRIAQEMIQRSEVSNEAKVIAVTKATAAMAFLRGSVQTATRLFNTLRTAPATVQLDESEPVLMTDSRRWLTVHRLLQLQGLIDFELHKLTHQDPTNDIVRSAEEKADTIENAFIVMDQFTVIAAIEKQAADPDQDPPEEWMNLHARGFVRMMRRGWKIDRVEFRDLSRKWNTQGGDRETTRKWEEIAVALERWHVTDHRMNPESLSRKYRDRKKAERPPDK